MLWIALHLPALPLESFTATLSEAVREQPVALLDAAGRSVDAANTSALALGIKPGLRRATALALAPQLIHHRRSPADVAREAQALAAVAHVALAFTPAVTLAGTPLSSSRLPPPQQPQPFDGDTSGPVVLLDVQASLRRFGGPQRSLPRLLRQLQVALAPLGHTIRSASAPTALGAGLLARCLPAALVSQPAACEHGIHCADLAELSRRLDGVPLVLLESGCEHREVLHGMGLHTLADLRRLPRGGLARRFGESLLDELDRALGRRPDPRGWVTLPAVFEARLELFARADTTEQVLYGAGLLLAQLVAWAQAQQVRVRRFALHMRHERHRRQADVPAASTLEIALAEPSCDAAHLRVLLRERLAHLQLAAPTLELHLQCADVSGGGPPNGELFASAGSEREGLTRLVERLQARLGRDRVQRLQPLADHRPECAASVCPADALEAGRTVAPLLRRTTATRPVPVRRQPEPATIVLGERAAVAEPVKKPLAAKSAWPPAANHNLPTPRPVWLLRKPQPLPECGSRPTLDGRPLQLLCGPERIEAGWWDAAGLAERDYFIAQAADGALVWVYRARLPLLALEMVLGDEEPAEPQTPGWFLQGRFA